MTDMSNFDAIVIGMGPGGEVVAGRLLAADKRVAVVERELVGGECAYWACIPSKAVLRAPEVVAEAQRVRGAAGVLSPWPEVREFRDKAVRHLDDSTQVDSYREKGAEVIKGEAHIVGPGRVEVGDRVLEAPEIIVATGSTARVPDVPGLDGVTVWTNREIYTARELPETAVVIGGSAVGVETALFLARFDVRVTLLQRGSRLMGREEPRVGQLAAEHLEAVGVEVRTSANPSAVHAAGDIAVVELDDGGQARGHVVMLGTGRAPRTSGLGLDSTEAHLDDRGAIAVDERCRAAAGLWAVGDVTGVMTFTHVAKYQGRIVADNILGGSRTASYEGIPRVVFADPEIAAVGLTAEQAAGQGIRTRSQVVDLPEALARPFTYESKPRGELGILVDTDRNLMVGAWAVAPMAGEWIHQASLAIRAQVPLDVLLDQVPQFPTYTEGYITALEALSRS